MNEPNLLDYLIAKLRFWRPPPESLPSLRRLWSDADPTRSGAEAFGDPAPTPGAPPTRQPRRWRLERGAGPPPLAVASALLLALAAQVMLALDRPAVAAGVVLLAGAAGAAVLAVRRGEVTVPVQPDRAVVAPDWRRPRVPFAVAAVGAAVVAGVAAADNRIGALGLAAWLAAVGLALASIAPSDVIRQWRDRVAELAARDRWPVGVGRDALLPLLLIGAAGALRTRDLASVPAEMVSDHAELILAMVRAGAADPPIIFPWGPGGLEPIPVYLGALLAPIVGGLSFAALKLGTVLAGLATLPLVYLVGREVGGRVVAVAALALAAVAPWPDLVSRTGLADAWLPPFAAAALLLTVRAVRRGRRVDFAAAGIAVGLGLATTSLARSLVVTTVILVAAAAVSADADRRRRLLAGLLVAIVFTALAGLPVLVAGAANAGEVAPGGWLGVSGGTLDQRATSGLVERMIRVLALPLWSNGPSWHDGGTESPGLDRVAGALFVLGVAVAVTAALRRRSPAGGLVLLALPVLLMPAWLAALEPTLAPSPVRCGGAIAAVFVLAGVGLAAVVEGVSSALTAPVGRLAAATVAALLVVLSATAGRAVVHGPFAERWDQSTWNASELGATVRAGIALGVPPRRARVVPWPHWVDTRLVAVEAGFPGDDLAIEPEAALQTAGRGGPQLYLLHPDDRRSLQQLRERLPLATVVERPSRVPGKRYLLVLDLSAAEGG